MADRPLTFRHRLGGSVDLPLLIPSFSSKGFRFFAKKSRRGKQIYSVTTHAIEALAGYMTESMLVSGYDLFHKHFRRPERFFRDTALVFLDSGGYELSPEFDSTEPKITPVRQLPFAIEDYETVLDGLQCKHKDLPLVISNFDWAARGKPLDWQIDQARRLFDRFHDWSSDFIIKPPNTVINVDEMTPYLAEMRGFDMIGVTEKELGKNLMDRLKRLAQLRVAMTERNITAPIHVWGGLDPLITPLYFFAGADVFDGVSWLRYTFHKGLAVNRDAFGILQGTVTTSYDHAAMLSLSQNLVALQGLATSLRAFASSDTPNFEIFEHNREILQKAFLTMGAKIPQLKEVC